MTHTEEAGPGPTAGAPSESGSERATPILGWVRDYQRPWLRADILAGLSTAAVVIPKAVAYGALAGIPIGFGLATAFIPALIYALIGSSRVLSVSTTSAIGLLTGAALAPIIASQPDRVGEATLLLSALVGGILLLAAILRLGFLGNFISDPVLTGFKAGIGIVIILDQIPKLFGIHPESGRFVERVLNIFPHLHETHFETLVVGALGLGFLFALDYFLPAAPGPLLVVAISIAASSFLHLEGLGVEVLGTVPAGLPPFTIPQFGMAAELWPAALGIALMAFTETIAVGRAFPRPDERRPAANRELVALGVANVGASLFGSMATSGGMSQTAVNDKVGARSPLAGVVTALCAAVTMLYLAPLLGLMPKAALAAVLVATTVGLVKPKELKAIAGVRKREFAWALVALVGVLAFGTQNGILLAVGISILHLMYEANNPDVYPLRRKPGTGVFRPISAEHPGDEAIPGMLIVRAEGRMTFASAPNAGERLWSLIRTERPKVVLLDCSAIPDIEYTALRMLEGFERNLARGGIALWLAELNPEPFRSISKIDLGATLGRARMYHTVEAAVEAYRSGAGAQPPI